MIRLVTGEALNLGSTYGDYCREADTTAISGAGGEFCDEMDEFEECGGALHRDHAKGITWLLCPPCS